jgi:glycosyltransferase involved in cell wall biosynthesis
MINTGQVALVHDYLTQFGGAEQVLSVLQDMFPDAATFTTLFDPATELPGLRTDSVVESGLGLVHWFRQHPRAALPLFPLAMWDIGRRLDGFDVAIADSSAWAHLVRPPPGQALVVYCHSTARFLYGDAHYLDATGVEGPAAKLLTAALRPYRWLDRRAYQRAHVVLANSQEVACRLFEHTGVRATVLHPPVVVDEYVPDGAIDSQEWFLVVSRLVPHKRIDLVVEGSRRHGFPVKIVGTGRDAPRLKRIAGPEVEFLGFQTREQVIAHMQRCRALILPGVEDFGMTAVEAQAAGRPVIAFNRGGARETVVDGQTGVLFDDQTVSGLLGAIDRLGSSAIDSRRCIEHARRFDISVFERGMREAVASARTLAAGKP